MVCTPLQGLIKQLLCVLLSVLCPEQSRPPFFGDGRLHDLDLTSVWYPFPHVREQCEYTDQLLQLSQPPLTERIKKLN